MRLRWLLHPLFAAAVLLTGALAVAAALLTGADQVAGVVILLLIAGAAAGFANSGST